MRKVLALHGNDIIGKVRVRCFITKVLDLHDNTSLLSIFHIDLTCNKQGGEFPKNKYF
jgi:hypothetical protein